MTNVLRREELERRDLVETGNGASRDAATSQEEPQKLQEASKDPPLPRDSQESSPTPQFKSTNPSALSFLHSPTLTSIHDHRKNHSLD